MSGVICDSSFGRFCFRRLPFGLNLSQDVFQERMDCILEKYPGTISIADSSRTLFEDTVHPLLEDIFTGVCNVETYNMQFWLQGLAVNNLVRELC